MISPEIVGGAVSMEAARKAWPGVADLDEIQDGGCPEFWKGVGIDLEIASATWLSLCRRHGDWTAFWNRVCPAGCLMYFSPGAKSDDELDEPQGEWGDDTFFDPADVCAEVFRRAVRGELDSVEPTFAFGTRSGVILYWRLKPADR